MKPDPRRIRATVVLIALGASVVLVSCDRDSQSASNVPAHEIVEVQDTNFGVRRMTYVIQLPEVYPDDKVLQIASWLIEDRHRKKDLVGGVKFHFYFPGSHMGRDSSDGQIEWAPDGDWSKTLEVTAGDYRDFRFNTHIWEGLTTEEIEEILAVPVSGEAIGSWYKHGPSRGVRILFVEEGKTYYMRQASISSPRVVEEISEVPWQSGR